MTAAKRTPVKATSVGAWKKQAAGAFVELPSGNVVRIRKIGLQALIAMGVVPNSLMAIMTSALAKGQKKNPVGEQEMAGLLANEEQVLAIGVFMDKVACLLVVEPKIHPVPDDGVDRDDDLLYVDEIGEEDKMFIFQTVTGGTTDVEQFRSELSANMDALHGREDVVLPTE